MLSLIKLEIKKFKLQECMIGAMVAHLILLILFLALEGIFQIEKEPVAEIIKASLAIISAMSRVTFVIFASVILSKIVISEYSNKTINLMFMYPISRKKIFLAKLTAVVLFTFINIVISNILLRLSLIVMSSMFHVLPWTLVRNSGINNIVSILLEAVLGSGTALIPLYFGMKRKSVPITIISSILVSSVMYSNGGENISLASILPISITIASIGILVGIGTLNKLDKEDVM